MIGSEKDIWDEVVNDAVAVGYGDVYLHYDD